MSHNRNFQILDASLMFKFLQHYPFPLDMHSAFGPNVRQIPLQFCNTPSLKTDTLSRKRNVLIITPTTECSALRTHYARLHSPVCLPSVVGVDVGLIFLLAALLEALLLDPVFFPLASPGGAGRALWLVPVAGGTERHPRVKVSLLPLQQFPRLGPKQTNVRPDTHRLNAPHNARREPQRAHKATEIFGCGSAPVGRDLNVQRHLDIQQVLVFTQVTGHFPFGAAQRSLQLLNGVLPTQNHTMKY